MYINIIWEEERENTIYQLINIEQKDLILSELHNTLIYTYTE